MALRALACCGLLLAAAAQDAEVQQVTLLEVQGEDAADSPLEGRTVRISALVSAVSGAGFYVQDDTGYGLYVYESTFRPAVGDTVVLVASTAVDSPVEYFALAITCIAGALAGGSIGFWIGRTIGPWLRASRAGRLAPARELARASRPRALAPCGMRVSMYVLAYAFVRVCMHART